jgi:hypothetical protein
MRRYDLMIKTLFSLLGIYEEQSCMSSKKIGAERVQRLLITPALPPGGKEWG